jgi:hypothetical protein
MEWKGGLSVLDIGKHLSLKRLAIYDINEEAQVIYSGDMKVSTKNIVGFALSPDGKRLAVVRGNDIELYALQ